MHLETAWENPVEPPFGETKCPPTLSEEDIKKQVSEHAAALGPEGRRRAEVYLASGALAGNLDFPQQMQPASYYRLEDIWLSEAIELNAYHIWEDCPNVFVLRPCDRATWMGAGDPPSWLGTIAGPKVAGVITGIDWLQTIIGQRLDLQLYCQAPGCWHPTEKGGHYRIDEPVEWLQAVAPYVQRLVAVLRFAAPLVGPWMAHVDEDSYEKLFKDDIELMKAVAEKLPRITLVQAEKTDQGMIAANTREVTSAEGASVVRHSVWNLSGDCARRASNRSRR
ncbi:hypothetical protein, partial [Candidatus Thiosymbion oneisti]|uniref:hypothetical protein n=1 Tax=Candidatus Thiosymbion oneisti TaxID=589554 RepID=UPI000AE20E18